MKSFSLFIAMVSTAAEAGQCPWQQGWGCRNAAGECNTDCAVSPWYASDGKCVCGPASSDWMTENQCQQCSADEAEVVSTEAEVAGQCPWQSHGCLNAAGQCNTDCAVSPWYASDGKCVCGPASSDWMTSGQCTACPTDEAEVVSTEAEVAGQCPWQSHGCRNAAGQCNTDCAESPWYASDGKCVCGPASSDWMTSGQCIACSADDAAVVSTEAEVAGQCPWQSHGCRNAAGQCNTDCAQSPWYASDGKCVCGPASSDWMTSGQCVACPTDEFV